MHIGLADIFVDRVIRNKQDWNESLFSHRRRGGLAVQHLIVIGHTGQQRRPGLEPILSRKGSIRLRSLELGAILSRTVNGVLKRQSYPFIRRCGAALVRR